MRALLFVFLATPAFAWDGNKLWQQATNDPYGSGGVWGTGGQSDFGISCTSCHVRPANMPNPTVDLQLAFSPPLDTVGSVRAYKPGQRYTVTATMTNETLGKSGCDQYSPMNNNGFGAAFELAGGARAGRYETDTGMDSMSCPATVADVIGSGTTLTYGDCHAVTAVQRDGMTAWTFYWTAPAAGSGTVKVFWGVVDGNCDMNSQNDDSKAGSMSLSEGSASAPRPQRSTPREGAARAARARSAPAMLQRPRR